MNKFLSLLMLLSATFAANAQIPAPGAPPTCNSSSCITNSLIDVCPPGTNNVVSATEGGIYNRGNDANRLAAGAIWRYRNMAVVSGVTINVEVSVDEVYQATLASIDDDNAVDQSNVSMASYFCPRISADQSLVGSASGDRRGYVQFTMRFFKNSTGANNNTNADFATPVNLTNLNYVHYDIDGFSSGGNVGAAGRWYRETGMAKKVGTNNPQVISNATTDLSAYLYNSGGSDWTGFAGGICEKDGVSKCAQNAAAFKYNGAFPSITFRMGYDYNPGGTAGRPVRQYGSRLGCFNFPQESVLPVTLVSFNAIFRNNVTTLKWVSENEVNFEKYIVERSNDGLSFSEIGQQSAQGSVSGETKKNYEYSDNLASASGNVFYYRLKMLDIDRKYTYSSTIMVRKEAAALNGIVLNPNPVTNGITTVRFSARRTSSADIRVLDMSGRTVLQQQTKVYEGSNSLSINQIDKLPPGIYSLQLMNEGEVSVIKFSVVR
ncbi:MAG: T9SS type A sorting domain-containing protein [Chitinophagaceae bacterium]|nr:MAG: T9SS type A sorting domain-containing protein [Chitinophagaceae bacterium]